MEPTKAISEKARTKIDVNLVLLATAFTVFTFIGLVNTDLLRENVPLSLQLTLAIPFLSSSIFARSKLVASDRASDEWERYGFFTFIFGYSFLVNAVGLMLAAFTRPGIAVIFWLLNIVSALIYSLLEVSGKESTLGSRAYKDAVFIVLVLLGGIFPALGWFSF